MAKKKLTIIKPKKSSTTSCNSCMDIEESSNYIFNNDEINDEINEKEEIIEEIIVKKPIIIPDKILLTELTKEEYCY